MGRLQQLLRFHFTILLPGCGRAAPPGLLAAAVKWPGPKKLGQNYFRDAVGALAAGCWLFGPNKSEAKPEPESGSWELERRHIHPLTARSRESGVAGRRQTAVGE